jgi:glycine dehydrogenase subunit 1
VAAVEPLRRDLLGAPLSRYTAITDSDRDQMLAAIGVRSVQELFERQIPERMRLGRALDLPAGMGEQEVYEHLRALAAQNVSVEDELSFLGAGMYDHYVPAIVDMLCERSEFLTPYTPYQPEVSQGGLQAMFEYQTAICELTGLPVSNASVYEGPSALASAAYMAKLHNGKGRFVVSAGLHPHSLQTLATYAHGFGAEIVEVPLRDGATDEDAWAQAIDGETGAAFFAQPNFYGAVEDAQRLVEIAKEAGAAAGGTGASDANDAAGGDARAGRADGGAGGRAGGDPVIVVQVDPITLGVLRSPGECGVDVAVGEGQPLGGRLDFGGPSFGFFAAREEYLRRMPGRIAGETVDADGRRGFVLTLQTREQHIRRERATSNICTAQALNALAGIVHLAWLGREGIVQLGELLLARTAYAKRRLCEIEGVSAMHERPAVREIALRLDADVAAVKRRCLTAGVNPGVDVHALSGRERDEGLLLVAITERRSRADIDRLVEVLGAAVAEEGGEPAGAASGTEAVRA